jgi:RNA polymerase sigma-70 factor (ECF subfamily)
MSHPVPTDRHVSPSSLGGGPLDPKGIAARERELIGRTRAGEYEAFDTLFVAYADALCAYVYGLLQSKEDAQEVVQDLFLWIWEHRAEWQVPGELRTYLYKSARNRAISYVRHRRVEHLFRLDAGTRDVDGAPSGGRPSALPETNERVELDELSRRVATALEELPERCRQVFLLSRQHHLSYAEVATVMNISPKTVEAHMARAFAGLRAALADWIA